MRCFDTPGQVPSCHFECEVHTFCSFDSANMPCARYFENIGFYDTPSGDDSYLSGADAESWSHVLDPQEEETHPDSLSDMNSDDLRRPLPDRLDEAFEDLEYLHPSPDPSFRHESFEPASSRDAIQSEDAANLRRVIGDSCAATPPVLSATMPWELPGISLIIGEEAADVPVPVVEPMPVLDIETAREQPSHRTACVEHIRGSYQEVIDAKLTLYEAEPTAASWDRALEKWYVILARGRSAWPRGYDIDEIVTTKGIAGLRPIFGNCSHNTVVKRANSIIRFTH